MILTLSILTLLIIAYTRVVIKEIRDSLKYSEMFEKGELYIDYNEKDLRKKVKRRVVEVPKEETKKVM